MLLAQPPLFLFKQTTRFFIHQDRVFFICLNPSQYINSHCCAFSLPDLSSHSPSKPAAGFLHLTFFFFLSLPSPFHSTNNHFYQISTLPSVGESYSLEYLIPLSISRVSGDGALLPLATTFPASLGSRVSAFQDLQASDFSTSQSVTIESPLRLRNIFFSHLRCYCNFDYHISLVFWSSDGPNRDHLSTGFIDRAAHNRDQRRIPVY